MGEPFKISIADDVLARIRTRVQDYRWPKTPENIGWALGANPDYVKELCDYWLTTYDWRKAEARLNALPNFVAKVDGLDIHYIHVKGKGENRTPLILTHGWPSTIWEFIDVMERLSEGGCDVIVPSLPGYAWSSIGPHPMSPRSVARLWDKLMHNVLGYETYVAQGGDWGSVVTGWLGYEGAHCKAIHLSMYPQWATPGDTPQGEAEIAHAQKAQMAFEMEGAYFRIQATKPVSLGMALADSPVGMAAWFAQMFHTWGDVKNDDMDACFSKDDFLTNLMIYLVTESFPTSIWMYSAIFSDPGGDPLPEGARITRPVGVANFPGDPVYTWPPQSRIERSMNVAQWTDYEIGGHFAALEQPALFADDVLRFVNTL